MTYTREEIIEELQRELKMRKLVYPDAIRIGRITRDQAARQYGILLQVLKTYQGQGELDLCRTTSDPAHAMGMSESPSTTK